MSAMVLAVECMFIIGYLLLYSSPIGHITRLAHPSVPYWLIS